VSETKFLFTGLDELKAELRTLPADLAAEASAIVHRSADSAATQVRSVYQAHRITGNLAEHVTVTPQAIGQYGAAVLVKSAARHSHLFESGTVVRHYVTVNGVDHLTGPMPGFHVFIPAMIRARRVMYADLAALLERHGLRVRGDVAA